MRGRGQLAKLMLVVDLMPEVERGNKGMSKRMTSEGSERVKGHCGSLWCEGEKSTRSTVT